MRILAIADEPERRLWESLDRRLLENVDVILSCGDLPAEYLSFLTCFTHAPIFYVHGNHDERYDRKPPEGCVCIEDQIVTYQGMRVMGLGGSMRYKPGRYQYTEADMQKRVRKLRWKLFRARGFDILLTHAPALGIGDTEEIPHKGFGVFLRLMDRYKPRYLIHGHMHKQYSAFFQRQHQYRETEIVNANQMVFLDFNPTEPAKVSKMEKRRCRRA